MKLSDYPALLFIIPLMLFLVYSFLYDIGLLLIGIGNWMTWIVNQSP